MLTPKGKESHHADPLYMLYRMNIDQIPNQFTYLHIIVTYFE